MDDKKKKKNDKGQPSSPQPVYVPKPSGPVPMIALQQTVETEIFESWNNKPFPRFPIHKDLPRFIRSILVVDSDGNGVYKPDREEGQGSAITRLLLALANLIEPDKIEAFSSATETFKQQDKVDSETMSTLLWKIDDLENVSSNTLKLLKGCNQSILSSALVNLQLSFMGSKFMFSDLNWSILIQFLECHIKIEHRRYESFTSGQGHFGWCASFLIKKSDMSLLSVKMRIFEHRIPDQAVADEWMTLIKPIFEPSMSTIANQIFSKPWDRLPLSKDLVRFASNTTLLLGNETVQISTLGNDALQHLKSLLLQFCSLFQSKELAEDIESSFDEHILKFKSSDLGFVIKSWLTDTLRLTDEEPVARMCKLFTQSILAPFATSLQMGMNRIYAIKDGTYWTISVSLVPSGFAVIHTKEQKTIERNDPTKTFDFVWKAQFNVDTTVSEIESVNISLVSLEFPLEAQMDQEQAARLKLETKSLLKGFLIQ